WRRETKRFGKSPGLLLCLRRRLPFAVDRREAAGVKDAAGSGVRDFEEIFTEIGVVNRPCGIARPLQRLQNHSVEAETLLRSRAGVEVVDAHCARSTSRDGSARRRRERE